MTTYTSVFGGANIYPSEISYSEISLDADVTLSWPEETSASINLATRIIDVTPTAAGFSIYLPDAAKAGTGETILFNNLGAFEFTVRNPSGVQVVTVSAGTLWQIYLTDNTTEDGDWQALQYGAATSQANASSLAGTGIVAVGTLLSQSVPITSFNSNYAATGSDRAKMFNWTGAGGVITMPDPTVVGNDWFIYLRNSGSGAIVATPPGATQINDDSFVSFQPGDSAIIASDGANFYTIGFGQSATFAFDYTVINVPGAGDYTLSGTELNRVSYRFTGILTNDRTIVVPATVQQYWVDNQTTGAYLFKVRSAASGASVTLASGERAIMYCDGVDVLRADTFGISYPIGIAQGGTGAITSGGALINLGGTGTGIGVFTAATPAAARATLGSTAVGDSLFIATDAATARTTISAAASGANSDITSLSGLTTALSVPQGGTGVATINGVLKGNGTSAFSAATPGTDFVAPGTATNFTATQTFTGTTSAPAEIVRNIAEPVTVSATAATGTIAIYPSTQSVLYYTSNASANWTVNLTWASGTTMNTVLSTGQAVTVAFMVTNGATAYYNTAVQIDGTTTGVTTRWQGGLAPSSGNPNGIDVYTYTIIKTGSATFTVLASVAQFT